MKRGFWSDIHNWHTLSAIHTWRTFSQSQDSLLLNWQWLFPSLFTQAAIHISSQGEWYRWCCSSTETLTMWQIQVECQEVTLEVERCIKFKGTARIRLECLNFHSNGPQENVERLKLCFQHEGCYWLEHQYHVPAVIDSQHLDLAVQSFNTSHKRCWATHKTNGLNYIFCPVSDSVVYRAVIDFKQAESFFHLRTGGGQWISTWTVQWSDLLTATTFTDISARFKWKIREIPCWSFLQWGATFCWVSLSQNLPVWPARRSSHWGLLVGTFDQKQTRWAEETPPPRQILGGLQCAPGHHRLVGWDEGRDAQKDDGLTMWGGKLAVLAQWMRQHNCSPGNPSLPWTYLSVLVQFAQ